MWSLREHTHTHAHTVTCTYTQWHARTHTRHSKKLRDDSAALLWNNFLPVVAVSPYAVERFIDLLTQLFYKLCDVISSELRARFFLCIMYYIIHWIISTIRWFGVWLLFYILSLVVLYHCSNVTFFLFTGDVRNTPYSFEFMEEIRTLPLLRFRRQCYRPLLLTYKYELLCNETCTCTATEPFTQFKELHEYNTTTHSYSRI